MYVAMSIVAIAHKISPGQLDSHMQKAWIINLGIELASAPLMWKDCGWCSDLSVHICSKALWQYLLGVTLLISKLLSNSWCTTSIPFLDTCMQEVRFVQGCQASGIPSQSTCSHDTDLHKHKPHQTMIANNRSAKYICWNCDPCLCTSKPPIIWNSVKRIK